MKTITTPLYLLISLVLITALAQAQPARLNLPETQMAESIFWEQSTPFISEFEPIQRSGRIVGGEDADISDYPWQVALMIGNQQFCGGSIIHEEWILTAAHCVADGIQPEYIRAGVTNWNDPSGQDMAIEEIIWHPGYGSVPQNPYVFDIALIRLSNPLDLSGDNAKAIRPVSPEDALNGLTDPGVLTAISGWGATSQGGPGSIVLQVAFVPIVSNEDAMDPGFYPPGSITEDMLTAGFLEEGGVDACQGDSGGPLAVPDGNGGWKLAGVTSWGVGCAQPGYPGVYARVSYFYDWMEEYIEFVEPDAPEAPADFVVTPAEMGGLSAELTWVNPAFTVDGQVLETDITIAIYRNDELLHTIEDVAPGSAGSYTDNDILTAGIYAYRLRGINEAGQGLSARKTVYVGEDIPAEVSNISLVPQGNDALLSWDTPQQGANNGWFVPENISGYHIQRMPDGAIFETGNPDTEFFDTTLPEIGEYYYIISAINELGVGLPASSETVLLASDGAIYTFNFTFMKNSGEPASGALVKINRLDGLQKRSYSITVPENGFFSLDDVWEGVYDLQVFLDGHHPITETGFDTAQDFNDLQFELYEYLSSPHSLEATNEGFEPDEALLSWELSLAGFRESRYDDGNPIPGGAAAGVDINTVFGNVHHGEMWLTGFSWWLWAITGDIPPVKLWVLGLTPNGRPDRNNVLFVQEVVETTYDGWHHFVMDLALYEEDGFFVGLISDIPLGLAIDNGVGEYPYLPATQFAILDITDESEPWYELAQLGAPLNLLLRATGFDLNGNTHPDNKNDDAYPLFNLFVDGHLTQSGVSEWEHLFAMLEPGTRQLGVQAVYDSGISEIVEISIEIEDATSVIQPDAQAFLRVFPNPAWYQFQLQSGEALDQVVVKDITGRIVYNALIGQVEYVIDVSQWQSGVYIISAVTASGKIVSERLVVTE